MKLRYTSRAQRDLANITTYIAEEQLNPKAAGLVLRRIEQTCERIKDHPHIGRASARPVTREFTVVNLPFTVVYRINADTVEVLTVFHESQDPTKKTDV